MEPRDAAPTKTRAGSLFRTPCQKTFEDLGYCYGKDVFDVFYKGELIPNADATTFSVDVDGKYAYDSSNTYYMGKKI